MRSIQRIGVAIFPIFLIVARMCAQNAPALPNAPEAESPVLTAQAGSATTTAMSPAAAGSPTLLTRQEAEKTALANNPRIRISQLIARVQHQVVRERRADTLPNLTGSLTAVGANDGSRISSGSIAASRLLEHAGMGIQLSQLITDFGRTPNLIASAKLQEKARLADAEASRSNT